MARRYCARPFEVEPVEVVDALGRSALYPDLAPRRLDVPAAYVNGIAGTSLGAAEMAQLLTRMQLGSTVCGDGARVFAARLARRVVLLDKYCARFIFLLPACATNARLGGRIDRGVSVGDP